MPTTNNRKQSLLIITIIMLLVLSCNLWNSFTPDPTSIINSVEGAWVPSVFSFDFLEESGYEFSEMMITFNKDNIINVINLPADWIFQDNYSNNDYFSGNGTWAIVEPMSIKLDDLEIKANIIDPTDKSVTIQFGVILDNLYFNLTKPRDNRTSVTFEKCYHHLHITDNIFSPLMQALEDVNRRELGFTPIDPKATVEVEGIIGETSVGLHVYGYTSRYITFKFENNKYTWISEQEIFRGLRKWFSSDGAVYEEKIIFQYQTEPLNGDITNALTIEYYGNDPRITNNPTEFFSWQIIPNKEEILPIINEWNKVIMRLPPFPQYLCP